MIFPLFTSRYIFLFLKFFADIHALECFCVLTVVGLKNLREKTEGAPSVFVLHKRIRV